MSENFGEWRDIASAPRDGTRILVELKASEQGPAEVDLVRWARPERDAEPCWVSAESDPGAAIVYADGEFGGWMPLPTPLPKLRSTARPGRSFREDDLEVDGSGI